MPLHARIAVLLIVLTVGVAARAAESTVYKVVDPEGKVTYQDHPPDPGTPAVERLQMRTDQNVLKSAPPGEEAAPETSAPAPPPPAPRGRAPQTEPHSPEARREEAAAIVEKALQNNEALGEPGEEGASPDTPPDAAAGSP